MLFATVWEEKMVSGMDHKGKTGKQVGRQSKAPLVVSPSQDREHWPSAPAGPTNSPQRATRDLGDASRRITLPHGHVPRTTHQTGCQQTGQREWHRNLNGTTVMGSSSNCEWGRCFVWHFFQSFVQPCTRHLLQAHEPYPPCMWYSNIFVFLAHPGGCHTETKVLNESQVASAAAPEEIWSNTTRINTF